MMMSMMRIGMPMPRPMPTPTLSAYDVASSADEVSGVAVGFWFNPPMGGPVTGGGAAELVCVGPVRGSTPRIMVAGGMLVPFELWQQSDASFPQQYLTPPLLSQLLAQGSSATPISPFSLSLISISFSDDPSRFVSLVALFTAIGGRYQG